MIFYAGIVIRVYSSVVLLPVQSTSSLHVQICEIATIHTFKWRHFYSITMMACSHLGWVSTIIETQHSSLWIIHDQDFLPWLRETPVQYLSDSLEWHRRRHGRFQPYIKLLYNVLHFHLSFYFPVYPVPQQQFNKYCFCCVCINVCDSYGISGWESIVLLFL